MKTVDRKTAVITGGTKGIGRAIVLLFEKNGFRVITCSRHEKDLANLEEQVGEDAIETYQADLANRDEVDGFVDFVKKTSNRVDVLVNNAGVFLPGAVYEESEENLEFMMNTNLYSAYHLTRGLVGEMISNKAGDIFNVCSVASQMAYPNGGSYSISKFALYGMSKALREELKPHGIRVTSVLPGATLTASWQGIDLPNDRFIKPEDVAEAIWGAYSLSRNSVVEDLVIRPQLGDI